MATKIQFRRDSAGAWTGNNPVLSEGEIGLDLTNQTFRIGDGTSGWNSLGPWGDGALSLDSDNIFTGRTTYNEATVYNDSAEYNQPVTYNSTVFVNDTLKVNELIERAQIVATAWSGTEILNLLEGGVHYNTDSSMSENITVNLRGDVTTTLNRVLDVGDIMSATIMLTLGVNPYNIADLQIDGVSQTPTWYFGAAPDSGQASGINAYNYTIVKTDSATFTVLGNRADYY